MHFKTQALSALGTASLALAASVPRSDNIVGGSNAQASDYSWQVSLTTNGTFTCGGAIISDSFVLTAAHCLDAHPSPDALIVRSGSEYTDNGGAAHAVQSYAIHPVYSPDRLINDIAVIKINDSFAWDPQTRPVEMADESYDTPAANTPATVAGWGLTEYGSTVGPKRLQAIDVPVVDMGVCIADYLDERLHVWPGMFCAGEQRGKKGSCYGDSGGALVDKESKKMIGVVSWGVGCAWPGKPGVYASVSFFREWIKQATGV